MANTTATGKRRGPKLYWTEDRKEKAVSAILDIVATGEFLGVALDQFNKRRSHVLGRATFNRWVREDEQIGLAYAQARRDAADVLFEQILTIAKEVKDTEGDSHWFSARIQEARLKIDTLKWMLAKMNPTAYSDYARRALEGGDGEGLFNELAKAMSAVAEEESEGL